MIEAKWFGGEKLFENIGSLVSQYGLWGVFLASFIGNAIPYSAVPYVAFILAYSATSNITNELAIAIVGGGGATLGKVLIFLVSNLGGKKASKESKENVELFLSLIRKKYFGFIIIVLFALTPLPDDVIYVPLGIAGYKFLSFLVGVFIGKFLLVLIVSILGKGAYSVIEFSLNSNLIVPGMILLIVVTFYLILMIFYLDWKKVIVVFSEKGFFAATSEFLKEMLLILTFRHENLRKRLFKKK